MATSDDIDKVRRLTNFPPDPPYTALMIGDLIDSLGINGAAASIWEELAATVVNAVDVSESGSSRKMSDLRKAYQAQAEYFQEKADEEIGGEISERPRTRAIERM